MNSNEGRDKKRIDELLNSDYDGIQEYDNDLPKWWVWLFAITVIFSIFYSVYAHMGPGLSSSESFAADMKELDEIRAAYASKHGHKQASDQDLLALVSNPQAIAAGKSVYDGKCMPCHGNLGQGLIGPNLTDDYYIHGGKITDMQRVVEEGVLDKGMIAWKSLLSREEIHGVVAYVWTLHGTNPPGAKEPQGERIAREQN